jgi:hypothetical protein
MAARILRGTPAIVCAKRATASRREEIPERRGRGDGILLIFVHGSERQ